MEEIKLKIKKIEIYRESQQLRIEVYQHDLGEGIHEIDEQHFNTTTN